MATRDTIGGWLIVMGELSHKVPTIAEVGCEQMDIGCCGLAQKGCNIMAGFMSPRVHGPIGGLAPLCPLGRST